MNTNHGCRPNLLTNRCLTHGGTYTLHEGCGTVQALMEVLDERARQYARYGSNEDLEDGTGPLVKWMPPIYSDGTATIIEQRCRTDYESWERWHGKPTWMHLVREEVAEAFKEEDPTRLEEELLQVAALCVSWREKIKMRRAARA